MTVTSTQAGDVLILRVSGRLDGVTSPEFETACQQQIKPEIRRVVLDLSGVNYVSSAGLRAVLQASKRVRASGGELRLCGLRGTVKDTMEISGFYGLFPVYDSAEAALAP